MSILDLKAQLHSALGRGSKEVSSFELEKQLQRSMSFLASILPARECQEIIATAQVSLNATAIQNLGLTNFYSDGLASVYTRPQCIDVVGLRAEPAGSEGGSTPTYTEARRVSASEIFSRMSDSVSGKRELLYAVVENVIVTNFKASSSAQYGSTPTIMASYKKLPTNGVRAPYTAATLFVGGSHNYFLNFSSTTSGRADTLRTYALTDHNTSVPGGPVFTGITPITWATIADGSAANPSDYIGGDAIRFDVSDRYDSEGKVIKLVDAWDEEFLWPGQASPIMVGWVRFGEGITLPSYASNNFVLIKRQSKDGMLVGTESYLSSQWDSCIVNHALSELWLRIGDGNRSQMHDKQFKEGLALQSQSYRGMVQR